MSFHRRNVKGKVWRRPQRGVEDGSSSLVKNASRYKWDSSKSTNGSTFGLPTTSKQPSFPKNRVWVANKTTNSVGEVGQLQTDKKAESEKNENGPIRLATTNRVWTASGAKSNNLKVDRRKEGVPPAINANHRNPVTADVTARQRVLKKATTNRVWTANSEKIQTEKDHGKPDKKPDKVKAQGKPRRTSTEYKTAYALKRRRPTSQKLILSGPKLMSPKLVSPKLVSRFKLVKKPSGGRVPVSGGFDRRRLSGSSLRTVKKTKHKIVRVRKRAPFLRTSSVMRFKLIRVKPVEDRLDSSNELNVVKKIGRHKLIRVRKASGGKFFGSRYRLFKKELAGKGRESVTKRPADGIVVKTRFKLVKRDGEKNASAHLRFAANHVLKRSLSLVRTARLKKQQGKILAKRYCMFYNRFGKCKKEDKCPYIHDPDKVAVCTRFLRGTCEKTDGSCPFSHDPNRDKMPVCSFFLRGCCDNDKCPYSHVRVSETAAVCDDFVRGFCPAGSQCTKKHVLECPDFAAKGECPNGKKCKLVHRRKRKRDDVDALMSTSKRRRKSSSVRTPAVFKRRRIIDGASAVLASRSSSSLKEISKDGDSQQTRPGEIGRSIKPSFLEH
eukprot:m.99421 g.99421  ORF g.99421 m.99421 type:complete len:610 (+) comp37067_c0_seq15:385-2214(+)